MDKRRKEEDMDCKTQAMAGVCVFWGNTRCLVVVLRQNTTRASGRIGVGQKCCLFQPMVGIGVCLASNTGETGVLHSKEDRV